MKLMYRARPAMFIVAACLAAILAAGCEDGGGGGLNLNKIGPNDPNAVVCMGDSITAGTADGGAPYPARLAEMTGKRVINEGRGGEEAGGAAGRIGSALRANRPGVVTILYGANDVLHSRSDESILSALRRMINVAREDQTIPVLATLTPMTGLYKPWSGAVMALNDDIRVLAATEEVKLVDLEKEFSDAPDLFLHDGLHPTDLGNYLIARAFAELF